VIERTGLATRIGSHNLFPTDQEALEALEPQLHVHHPLEAITVM
jgi:hypothetical protein